MASKYAEGGRDPHYGAQDEPRCDPESAQVSLGVVVAVVLSTPLWMLIFWLIL